MGESSSNTVAILLATYNGERFIGEQLSSIAAQTYEDWALWISDDGSSDKTLQLVAEFSAQNPGKVHLLPQHAPTGGSCQNFFHLMREVPKTYKYYAFCDQDDYWHPQKVEKTLTALKWLGCDADTPVLAFCDAKVVDAGRNTISDSFFAYTGVNPNNVELRQLLVQNPISGAEVIANRALVELASDISSLDGIDMHDQWLGLVAAAFGKIAHVDEALFDYRQHGNNQVGAKKMSLATVGDKAKIAADSLRRKEAQAAKLVKEYSSKLSAKDRELCQSFASIGRLSKAQRLRWCKANGIEMNGTMRNIGLALFI